LSRPEIVVRHNGYLATLLMTILGASYQNGRSQPISEGTSELGKADELPDGMWYWQCTLRTTETNGCARVSVPIWAFACHIVSRELLQTEEVTFGRHSVKTHWLVCAYRARSWFCRDRTERLCTAHGRVALPSLKICLQCLGPSSKL